MGKRGTKGHIPTDKLRAEVSMLRSFGIPTKEIAAHIGISDDRLVVHYKSELDTAIMKANARVANALYRRAIDKDDLSAQIFWLKTRARWRERDDTEVNELKEMIAMLISSGQPELEKLKRENEMLKAKLAAL